MPRAESNASSEAAGSRPCPIDIDDNYPFELRISSYLSSSAMLAAIPLIRRSC